MGCNNNIHELEQFHSQCSKMLYRICDCTKYWLFPARRNKYFSIGQKRGFQSWRHISEHTQSNIAADLIIQQQYVDTAAPVDKFLSSAQTILSSESEGFNSRIGGHYWADDSRDLIAVIQALRDFNTAIQPQGWELQTKPGTFLNQLFDYLSFLSESGGSEIPPRYPANERLPTCKDSHILP